MSHVLLIISLLKASKICLHFPSFPEIDKQALSGLNQKVTISLKDMSLQATLDALKNASGKETDGQVLLEIEKAIRRIEGY